MLWPTILTGFFFAITLVIVVIPSLYIADLDDHTVYQPSSANAIHADTTQTSPGIRQRIYLIFMIPAMAVANGLWVYLMYYRHVRNAFYRMEIGELENSRVSRAGKPVMKLLNRAAAGVGGCGTGDSTPAQQHPNSSMISADTSYAFAASSSKHNILPPTSSSSFFPAVSSHHFPPLSREPSNSSPFATSELFHARSFVLASLPSSPGGTASSPRDYMQHRRRADVSREECPVPFCSGVASLVNIVDRVLDEGAVLRSKAASELLRRVAAAKKSILAAEEQQKVNNDRTSTAISSPGTAASPVFRLNAAVQGFSSNSVMSLDDVQQELEELQEIASEHPHLASPISHGTTFPPSTKPKAIAVDDAGYAASLGAGEGASPTTKAKTTRMKRAGSRVVFTRSRSQQQQQQQQQGPSSRGGSPRVVGVGSFASRASSTRVGPHVNEPDAA